MIETRELLIRPSPPYRLDLVVRVLRRRPDNRVDRWDGRAWSRTLVVGGAVCRWTVRQVGPPDEPLLAALLETEEAREAVARNGLSGGALGFQSDSGVGETAKINSGASAETASGGEIEAGARLALDRLLGLSVDLTGFHAFAARDDRLGELALRWRGFRPPRFPTLFEALLNAVACQQITLTQGIRRLGLLAGRFGRSLPEVNERAERAGRNGESGGDEPTGRAEGAGGGKEAKGVAMAKPDGPVEVVESHGPNGPGGSAGPLCRGGLNGRGASGDRALPEPSDLLEAPAEAFREMGFSRQRAETILRLAELAARGGLDAEEFQALDDAQALARLKSVKGIGLWSAEYALLRGLGRLNIFPGDDVGAQQNIQRWLGLAEKPDSAEARRLFGRYAPWQGMVYFLVLLDRLETVPGM